MPLEEEVVVASAKFLDLTIMLTRGEEDTRIEYRRFRKEGNTMAYLHLLAESYHPEHTMTGIVKAEFLRRLLKSSRREFYVEDATLL